MIVQINQSLAKLNTFGIDQKASRLIWAHSADEIANYVKHHGAPTLVLGGGSNMLLTQNVPGDVLKVDIHGRRVVYEDDDKVHIRFGAGENWHEVVLWTLMQGLGGIENLSLIPGNCGTAPVQNIGAYGVELKDVFVSCEGVMVEDGSFFHLNKEEAKFGYRNSIFKNDWKGKAIITRVTLELTKRDHRIRTDYGAIASELEKQGIKKPTPKQISDVVVAIRQSKLPDPNEIGNSGSFFKNPVVSTEKAEELQASYPNMPSYPAEGGTKLAAGWIIDQCGWKGYRKNDAGVHEHQALVLVNYGRATGEEIHSLATSIMEDVYKKFGVQLEPEVNLI
ncbi:MAG: UDP-N-acetylenolpyruvoylglucosamine reductase [Cryomorphaceae bacterium]|nr:MAG: UDP-N-acetylenolpyruvoylglucosamine reductase [Cryomorphaceae bacterium]